VSDEKKTENPFKMRALSNRSLSDEALPRAETKANEVELHPIHFGLPLAGYACFPIFVGLAFSGTYVHALVWLPLLALSYLILLILPFYAGFIFWLTFQRIKGRKRGFGLTLFQILSIAPPLLLSLRGMSLQPIFV
jgi:hypothetical protein